MFKLPFPTSGFFGVIGNTVTLAVAVGQGGLGTETYSYKKVAHAVCDTRSSFHCPPVVE